MVSLIGETVSHYKILKHLGEGGMGVVYKAEDTRLRRTVALKFLPPELTRDSEAKERFVHEAQAASALQHNNICVVHDIDETSDGQMFISVEYLEGETLKKRIERGPLKFDEAIDIAIQVGQGLAKAHEHGIVHRDIKPANIMLTTDSVAKIVDFGVAKLSGRTLLTRIGTTLGTVAYMSPEQARGEPADHRTDIWSLGVVIYQMITGQLPFKGDYENAAVYSILNTQPEPMTGLRTGVPIELDRIAAKALAKSPAERYQGVDDLIVDLRHLQTALFTPGQPPSGVHGQPRRHTKGFVTAAIGVCCIMIIGGVWWVWTKSPQTASPYTTLNPRRILVAVLENHTNNPSLDPIGRMAADWITQGLSQIETIEVVSSMMALGDVLGRSPSGTAPLSTEELRALAHQCGAGLLVSGNFYQTGEKLQFHSRVTETIDGRLVQALPPIDGPLDDPLKPIQLLSQKITSVVFVKFDIRTPGITYLQPPLFPAYQEYLMGLEFFGKDYGQALYHFQEAQKRDPDFVRPLLYTAVAFGNLGEYARADSVAREVNHRRDRLSFVERYLLDWYLAALQGNSIEALRNVKEAEQLAPQNVIVLYIHGLTALNLNLPRETVETYAKYSREAWEAFTKLPSGSWAFSNLAEAHHMLGDYESEIATIREWRNHYPQIVTARTAQARVYAVRGQLDSLQHTIEEAMSMPSQSVTWSELFEPIALELRAHRQLEASRAVAARGLSWLRTQISGREITAEKRYNLARALYLAERWDESEEQIRDLLQRESDNVNYLGLSGILAARKGDRVRAERISESLKLLKKLYLYGSNTYWRACIASLIGEKEVALSLLRQAFAEGWDYGISMHRDIDLEPLRGYQPFIELLRPKG